MNSFTLSPTLPDAARRVVTPLIAVIALVAVMGTRRASMADWGPNGNQVTSGYQTPTLSFAAAPDGQSGVFVIWSQPNSGSAVSDSIRCLRLQVDGTLAPGWPAGGRAVCAAPYSSIVSAAPDDSGGLYVVFVRALFSGTHDLHAIRLRHDGSVAAGWPSDGLVLSTTPNAKIPLVCADGLGGAGLFWQELSDNIPFSGAHSDFYATRLLPQGSVAAGWPAGGLPVKVGPPALKIDRANPHRMVADGTGGFYLAWIDSFSTTNDLYVQRLAADGTLAPGWLPGGRTACAVLSDKGYFGPGTQLASAGADGAYLGWNELRSGRLDGYVMRVDGLAQDAPGWPPDAMVPSGGSFAGILFGLDGDGVGGALLGYELYRLVDVYALGSIGVCRVDRYGSVQSGWPAGGVVVSDSTQAHRGDWIASDGAGGARVVWDAAYASRVTGSGQIAPGWPASGRLFTATPVDKHNTLVVPDRHGGEIVLWVAVSMAPYEIFAQRIGADGSPTTDAPRPPVRPGTIAAAPNPFRSSVEVSLALRAAGEAEVIVCDLAGRVVRTLARGPLEAGPHRFSWDGRSEAGSAQPPGLYLVRARAPGYEARGRMMRLR